MTVKQIPHNHRNVPTASIMIGTDLPMNKIRGVPRLQTLWNVGMASGPNVLTESTTTLTESSIFPWNLGVVPLGMMMRKILGGFRSVAMAVMMIWTVGPTIPVIQAVLAEGIAMKRTSQ